MRLVPGTARTNTYTVPEIVEFAISEAPERSACVLTIKSRPAASALVKPLSPSVT